LDKTIVVGELSAEKPPLNNRCAGASHFGLNLNAEKDCVLDLEGKECIKKDQVITRRFSNKISLLGSRSSRSMGIPGEFMMENFQ
jgi:hypothetical protein